MRYYNIFIKVCTCLSILLNAFDEQKIDAAQKSSPPFVILTCDNIGMFSSFKQILGALNKYEKGKFTGVKVNFGCNGKYGPYHDSSMGPNWWEYYFEPINVGQNSTNKTFTTSTGGGPIPFGLELENNLSRIRVNSIIKKYVFVKKAILDLINEYISSHFNGSPVIGVHYRGTDKMSEAPRASYEEMTGYINEEISKLNIDNFQIFVATDEQGFIDYIIEQYPDHMIYYEGGIRSQNGKPIHLTSKENYKKGEDCLVDCLLLSKCQVLIKTSSNLSLCSSYFNPDMKVVHVTLRYR